MINLREHIRETSGTVHVKMTKKIKLPHFKSYFFKVFFKLLTVKQDFEEIPSSLLTNILVKHKIPKQ